MFVPATAGVAKKVWTEAELMALPEDGFIHEIVDGELVMTPKKDFWHAHMCVRLSAAIEEFNREHKLGVVANSSTGFWMSNGNCRAPDISFLAKARLQSAAFSSRTRRFFPGAPDLAVEILSVNNTRSEIEARLKDFFSSGTQIAWVINPDSESLEGCHSLTERKLVGPEGYLEGEQLLPEFRYPIGDLFKEWSWE
jgi:Uma2 family endonuclease